MATQYISHPPPLSPFENAFLTASPFSAELLSLLSTSAKFNLFSCSYAMSMFRDSCYTWQDVSLTKNGYEPMTSLKKVNYQIDSRIRSAQRLPVTDQSATELRLAQTKKQLQESQVNRYFCPNLRDAEVWSLLNSRPGIGSVLSYLTLDGTNVTMKLVKDVAAKCATEGYGLKFLSIRYCERIRFEEVRELFPIAKHAQNEEDDDDEDSGFESSSEHGEDEDPTLKNLKTLQIYGVRDLAPNCTQLRSWYHTVEDFKSYCRSRNMSVDIAWCSPSPPESDRLRRRNGCKAVREVPFCRVLPLADTGSSRRLRCTECDKTPEQLGWYCDGCVKDLLCEDCGTFVCDRCDPSRSHLTNCSDCSVRRCTPCFTALGGGFCSTKSCKKRATCGAHTRELPCDNCTDPKTVVCAQCNPTGKCHRCSSEIYVHCGEAAFKCDCDFELCRSCFEWSKESFRTTGLEDGSLEEMVTKLGGEKDEFPAIVPLTISDDDSGVDGGVDGWSCVWCRILPRRRERIIEQKIMNAARETKTTKRTRRS